MVRNVSNFSFFVGAILAWVPTSVAQQYVVTTIAGNGVPDVGDGGPAIAAVLDNPSDLAVGPDGSLYVVDTGNHRIRRITSDGIIRTVAGTGSAANRVLGDGGLATQAQLRFPRGIAISPDGLIYVADSNYYRVRRVGIDGVITTVAGTGNFEGLFEGLVATQANLSFPRDAAVDAQGAFYITDGQRSRIYRVGADGILRTIAGTGEPGGAGDGGPATAAQVDNSGSLAVFGRTLYVAAPVSGGVRRIDLDSLIISRINLNGLGSVALAVDSVGNLYVTNGGTVLRVVGGTGPITTIATWSSNSLTGIAVDAQSNVFVADNQGNRVNRIRPSGAVEAVAGGRSAVQTGVPAAQATIYDSQGMVLDREGSLFFSDFDHGYIRKLDRNGIVTTIAGDGRNQSRGDGGPPLQASFGQARPSAFTADGSLIFIDQIGTGTVRMITPGSDGIVNGGADERITTIAGQMASFDLSDRGRADGGPATKAVFDRVRGIALDSRGNLYIAEWLENRIRKVVPGNDGIFNSGVDEVITTIAGNGLTATTGDGGLASQASVNRPNQIVIDTRDNIYVWEVTNGVSPGFIRRIDGATGIITTYAKPFDVDMSWSLATDAADNLYFATGTQVYRIDAQTKSRTLIAGTGARGFSGDGGDARQATFEGVQFIASDAQGNIYASDNGNFRIRKISHVTGAPPVPVIMQQPQSLSAVLGSRAVLAVTVASAAQLTYQWRRNGVDVSGATSPTLTFNSVQPGDAGVYTVMVRNAAGGILSVAAILSGTPMNDGRLINLSVLTDIAAAGDDFTLGYVVGGAGTVGAKPLVIRAAGPSLVAFGVPGTLDDPKLELFAGTTKTGENDNWGGSAQLSAALSAVGAFAFNAPTSRDAALTASITTRDNSVKVSAVGSGIGKVIAEIYDATPAASFTAATPRLVNVSVRKHLGSGLTVGFVIGGATPAKVLVRAIGPTLGVFGVPGIVADPQLALFNASSVKISENNDWSGTTELTAAFAAVGAFALPATAKDAALLVRLPPGQYSAQVSGVNTTTGVALVEVYEVP